MISEELLGFIRQQGGSATSKEMVGAGFSPSLISRLLKKGEIEQVTRGVYILADEFEDDFSAISMRWTKCVFSHESALYLRGLSDRTPERFDVTVPRGYNPTGFKGREFPLRTHYCPADLYELGLSSAVTPMGNDVAAYDLERCICDIVKQKRSGNVDPQVFASAVSGYFGGKNKDISKLASYAKKLGVFDEVHTYMEVMA